MKQLVEYISKALVDNPDQVQVTQIQGSRSIILRLTVSPEDKGKVIGKQGRIANAMRILVRVAAAKEGKEVTLEIR